MRLKKNKKTSDSLDEIINMKKKSLNEEIAHTKGNKLIWIILAVIFVVIALVPLFIQHQMHSESILRLESTYQSQFNLNIEENTKLKSDIEALNAQISELHLNISKIESEKSLLVETMDSHIKMIAENL